MSRRDIVNTPNLLFQTIKRKGSQKLKSANNFKQKSLQKWDTLAPATQSLILYVTLVSSIFAMSGPENIKRDINYSAFAFALSLLDYAIRKYTENSYGLLSGVGQTFYAGAKKMKAALCPPVMQPVIQVEVDERRFRV